MRFFNKITKTEVIKGVHDTESADVLELSDDNVFFQPVPESYEIEFNKNGEPVGLVPAVQSLDELKALKIVSLTSNIKEKIVSKFESIALGSVHFYPSKEEDQLNLAGLVAINIDAAYVCEDERGVWDKRPHTAGQLKKAAIDGAIWKSNLLDEFRSRRDAVETAATVEQIDAVSEVF